MSEIIAATAATPPPHSCGGCANRWGGASTAHCATCHNTFTGVSAFDRHRRSGTCLDPSSVGMIQKRSYGCWGFDDDRPERSYPSVADQSWREDRWV